MKEPNTPAIQRPWIRVLLFCICFLLIFLMAGSIYSSLKNRMNISDQAFFFGSFVVSFIFSMLTVYVFRRFVDGRSLVSLGFTFRNYERHAAVGLLLAIAMLGLESLILHFTGHLSWISASFNASDLFTGLLLMMLVAIAEEAVFRGYMLHNLLQSMNKWVALGITSLLFALFHSGNPGITVLAMVNIFLSGFLMGLNYLYTKNLWFAILFHFGWNFFLGPVLGYEVSGLPLNSLLEQYIEGPTWLTGGEFGLEGSVLDGIFSIIFFVILFLVYERTARSEKLQVASENA